MLNAAMSDNSFIKIFQIFILFLLIGEVYTPILCQNKKYAIISEIAFFGKSDRNKIELLTTLLKREKNVNTILLSGNVESANSLHELRQLTSFISENNLNVKIIAGYNDYSNSILSQYLVRQEIDEQTFVINYEDVCLFGFNSVIPFEKDIGYVNIESLVLLDEESKALKGKLIYSFSNLPLNKIINRSQLLNRIKNNKMIYFYPEENKFTVKIDQALEIGLPGIDKNNKPVYHLIENKNDSIFVIKKYFDNDNTEFLFAESLNKLKVITEQTTASKKDNPTYKQIIRINYNSTSTTKLNLADNRIYITIDN
ncbi:MAG TPA: hypothetical protein PK073_08110, partial [Ignavibacteriaceae bacterium]|nr:hypothetical protein [Ignavibacteriaceae bacterium]